MSNCVYLLNKTEDYIEANLHEKITIDDLAKHLHISKYHYHRQFSRCSLETLHQFISRIKMERSAIQLMVSPLSITDIAHLYGFNDSGTFSKSFKRHYGLSPREFKKSKK